MHVQRISTYALGSLYSSILKRYVSFNSISCFQLRSWADKTMSAKAAAFVFISYIKGKLSDNNAAEAPQTCSYHFSLPLGWELRFDPKTECLFLLSISYNAFLLFVSSLACHRRSRWCSMHLWLSKVQSTWGHFDGKYACIVISELRRRVSL